MRLIRSFSTAVAMLGIVLILAACGQPAGDPASPTASPIPTDPPAEEPTASPTPSASPSASPIDVVEFELPMFARSTADGVDVHAKPSADAPLLIGEQFPDMNRVEIRLEADELVAVSLGPLLSGGTSWYQVAAVDGGERAFAFGWVSAEFLVRESDPPQPAPQVVTAHGLGSGASIDMTVPMGTPLTVDVAAAPMPDQETCDIDVTLIRTDGLGVNVATQTVTEPDAFQFGASIDYGGLQSLFQEEAGTATLEVETDCSYAASLTQPPY
jgi:hypothetical protein